ncbi:hypothetical protein ACQ5SO_02540 [Rhodovulum sp. DZ06]|uniref:hypothetical protein n=1 Tax=Rhodovulum sp. DZ06 TaxID=3425126 RepID=UPI003D3439F5
MTLIADGLLIGAAVTAAIYCHVLSRRLRKLGDLDKGLGGAVAALSRQADDLRKAMETARKSANEQTRELAKRTARAEAAAGRLEILIAAMHDAESRLPRPLVRAAAPRAEDPETDVLDPEPELEAVGGDAPEDEPRSSRDALAAAIRALSRGGAS